MQKQIREYRAEVAEYTASQRNVEAKRSALAAAVKRYEKAQDAVSKARNAMLDAIVGDVK